MPLLPMVCKDLSYKYIIWDCIDVKYSNQEDLYDIILMFTTVV